MLALCILMFACGKDTPPNDPTPTTPTALKIETAPPTGLVQLTDALISNQNKETKPPVNKGGDIEDVIAPPAGEALLTETCDKVCPTFLATTQCDNLCMLLRLAQTWEIKAGQRFGAKTQQDVCGVTTTGSAFSCFELNGQKICGYEGKEKAFRLAIAEAGNYRVQLSPTDKSKNFDIFVFKNEGTDITDKLLAKKTCVAWSRNQTGAAETVHLTQRGHYYIVIDEFSTSASCNYGSFILSVSPATNIISTPTTKEGKIYYTFSVVKTPSDAQLVAWSFRKNNPNIAVGQQEGVLRYPLSCQFTFDCADCDYLVAPVYKNTTTGVLYEDAPTMIRP
jgi:hypothetical protein